jgi:predicted nucleic acid-binding protein
MIDMSSTYKISAEDHVFVDTNILIFLFAPTFSNSKKYQVDKYSTIFKKLVEKKSTLYINATVISEFINKCLRLDFAINYNKDGSKDYKQDYRPSPEYKATLKIVLKELKKVLRFTKAVNDDFESFDLINQLTSNIESDFNDLIIADTVQKKNLKLLSDDGDFKQLGINTDWYIGGNT